VFDSLLLDQDQPAQMSKKFAARLWNERHGHWSLLCLDLVAMTAIFYDSLDGSVSERMRWFCAARRLARLLTWV
jgi:hypothetical protein